MAIYRAQCSFAADSDFPRDQLVITPHFKDTEVPGTQQQPQNLANDLANALLLWAMPANSRRVTVKLYNAEAPPPSFPLATAVRGTLIPGSPMPREIALCLSFYAERNLPRQRGRLYIPAPLLTTSAGLGLRPDSTFRTKVADLVPIFTGLGGVDVDWCVWSRAERRARSVTNWFVDDEWDIQRRRGLRATTRTSGTTTE